MQKIKNLDELKKDIETLKSQGKKIVFTNGCFDILHIGHTRYLADAKKLGDHLIVAVNSDRSVKTLKGEKRPVISQDQRAEILAALSCTDSIVIFDQETPKQIIDQLIPDILVKGGDWKEDDIVGAYTVKKNGGTVKSIKFIDGSSSTSLINKIKTSS